MYHTQSWWWRMSGRVILPCCLCAALLTCGLFTPQQGEAPQVYVQQNDPFGFDTVFCNDPAITAGQDPLSVSRYDVIFHRSDTFYVSNREVFATDRVLGRLDEIISTYPDIRVHWDVSPEWCIERMPHHSQVFKTFHAALFSEGNVRDTTDSWVSSFTFRYIQNRWMITRWEDNHPSRSLFHPLYQD